MADAVAHGARLELGGRRRAGRGYYFEPTVLTGADHRMALMREESFGPIIGIQEVGDDAEAVALMNDTEYGLTAAVYTRDRDARGAHPRPGERRAVPTGTAATA